jgi:hypothetical protein
MSKQLLIIGFTFLSFLLACKKEQKTPACIENKIEAFKNIISCNIGSNVKEYDFQSKRVFVFDPGNCGADMTSEVFDEQCNSIGFLGGITGNNKINGEDFSKAKLKQTLWSR